MSYLLGITIGPIQSYIEESRKLKDLRNSSLIMSNIMVEIVNYINRRDKNNEVIYPKYENFDRKTSCSNYMVFKIQNLINMQNIEDEIFNRLIEREEIEKLFKNYFHLYWAIEKIECGYDKAYDNLQIMMNSLKNTYIFEQEIQKGRKKCSLCGKRDIYTKGKEESLWADEKLCQFCLFKRNYEVEAKNKYGSTYAIALKSWKDRNKAKLKDINKFLYEKFDDPDKYYSVINVENILKLLNKGKTVNNSNKLKEFKEDLNIENKKQFNEDNYKCMVSYLEELKNKLELVYKEIDEPNYEYAFIQCDVDNLGRWMSGEYIRDRNENLVEYQQKISQMLVGFGNELKDKLYGKCEIIYSGGDDFLGILSNENIIDTLKIIDEIFQNKVRLEIEKEENIQEEITYSTSITIANCKEPMGEVIKKSRQELEKVKARFENKNGVVFNYTIRSGKDITCYIKRKDLYVLLDLVDEFSCIKNYLSFSYIRNFEDEFSKFDYRGITFEDLIKFHEMVKYELKRLMLRSKDKSVDSNKMDKYIENMVEFILNSIVNNYVEEYANQIYIDFNNIISIMRINEKLIKSNKLGGEGNGDIEDKTL